MHEANLSDNDARREARVRAHLDALGIEYSVHRHPSVATVEEARAMRGHLEGAHVKNLFLTDRTKERFWLVTTLEDATLDLNALKSALEVRGSLRFASAERLLSVLDLEPGSVTPLAVIADLDRRVTLILDERLRSAERINVHQMHNAATLTLAVEDLERALIAADHRPWWMRLPERS